LLWDPLAMAADVVIAGDLVYSQTQAEPARRAVQAWLARGSRVVLADSGRPFFDACGLPCIHTATVPVPRVVEGVSEREVRVYASP
jgi:predicted nicotinamide N-methyase